MSTAKKFAGQTAVYGLSTIVQRLLSSLLTPLYTAAYAPKTYSIFSTLFSYAAILTAILSFGMETTFFRYLNKHPEDKKQVYNNGFWVIFMLTVAFVLLTVPFTQAIAAFIKIGYGTSRKDFELFVKFFVGILVLDAWAVIPFARLRADGRSVKYGVIKLVNILVMVGLNLVFIIFIPYIIKQHLAGWEWLQSWYREDWVGYVFISNLVASAVTLILLLPYLLQVQLKLDGSMLRNMLKYSWPILIANVSYIINENLDRLLLGKLLPPGISESEVGIYSACARISIFLSLFIQAFRMGAEPFFFSHAGNANARYTYARIMNFFVMLMCVIFVAVVANIEILKYYVQNSDYWVGLNVVPPLLLGYVCLGIYMNLSVWYKLSDQTQYALYISGAGAILTIVLNVVFIPKYSYMASAWTSMAAYLLMVILSYVWGRRHYPIPYNVKKNLIYIVTATVVVYVSFVVFRRNIFIGNALLAGYTAAAFYFERKEILSIFRR